MLDLDNMDKRGRTFLIVCCLTFLPLAIALPVSYRQWSIPQSTGWLLCLATLLTIYCEFRALFEIENKLSGKRDIFWVLRIPIGLVAACIFVVSVFVCLFIAIPRIIFGDIPALLAKLR
jgi:hypothetical protein